MAASTFNHRDYANAWSTHAVDKILDFYAENARVQSPEVPHPIEGKAAVRQNVQEWLQAFPDVTCDIEHVAQDGQNVAILAHFSGLHKGALPLGETKALPATNKKVDTPVAMFLTLDANGKIVKERDIFDMAAFRQQLGVAAEGRSVSSRQRPPG